MPLAVETDRTTEPTDAPRFWRRQHRLPVTRQQIAFDLLCGVIAPVLCLLMDPGILRGGGLPGASLLAHFQLFAYLEIGICIAGLCLYLVTRRASAFLAGVLFTGVLFSLAVGIMILPLTLVGIFMLIGRLGLTPFFTACVFLRNAIRCWSQFTQKRSPMAILTAATAAVLTLMVPLGIQLETVRITDRALVLLQSGTDQEADRAIQMLKFARFAVDVDALATAYAKTKDQKQREHLARAFHEITGENIEDRLVQLND